MTSSHLTTARPSLDQLAFQLAQTAQYTPKLRTLFSCSSSRFFRLLRLSTNSCQGIGAEKAKLTVCSCGPIPGLFSFTLWICPRDCIVLVAEEAPGAVPEVHFLRLAVGA